MSVVSAQTSTGKSMNWTFRESKVAHYQLTLSGCAFATSGISKYGRIWLNPSLSLASLETMPLSKTPIRPVFRGGPKCPPPWLPRAPSTGYSTDPCMQRWSRICYRSAGKEVGRSAKESQGKARMCWVLSRKSSGTPPNLMRSPARRWLK